MIKHLGKYYNGPKKNGFITNYEMVKWYDDVPEDYIDMVGVYYSDGEQIWNIRPTYRDETKDFEDKMNIENQLLKKMKEQLKYIDFEKLRGKALEEYEKYIFFLNHENELNFILREQAIKQFGIEDSILLEQLITIIQLDIYSLEDLQAILDGTYGREFNKHIK